MIVKDHEHRASNCRQAKLSGLRLDSSLKVAVATQPGMGVQSVSTGLPSRKRLRFDDSSHLGPGNFPCTFQLSLLCRSVLTAPREKRLTHG